MTLISGHAIAVSRSNTGYYNSLVDINATADFVHGFKTIGTPFRTNRFANDYRERRH